MHTKKFNQRALSLFVLFKIAILYITEFFIPIPLLNPSYALGETIALFDILYSYKIYIYHEMLKFSFSFIILIVSIFLLWLYEKKYHKSDSILLLLRNLAISLLIAATIPKLIDTGFSITSEKIRTILEPSGTIKKEHQTKNELNTNIKNDESRKNIRNKITIQWKKHYKLFKSSLFLIIGLFIIYQGLTITTLSIKIGFIVGGCYILCRDFIDLAYKIFNMNKEFAVFILLAAVIIASFILTKMHRNRDINNE